MKPGGRRKERPARYDVKDLGAVPGLLKGVCVQVPLSVMSRKAWEAKLWKYSGTKEEGGP